MATAATFIVTGMTKTQLRRQQRRHSQVSYNKLRLELLNVVKPLPYPAIVASDLEQFTTSLFDPVSETCRGLSCKWCGIWLPLPGKSPIIGEHSLSQHSLSTADVQTLAPSTLREDNAIYVIPARRVLRSVRTTDVLSPPPLSPMTSTSALATLSPSQTLTVALDVIPARRALRISHTTDLLPTPPASPSKVLGAVDNLQAPQPLPQQHAENLNDSDCHISKQTLPKCGFLQFRDAYNLTKANWSLHLVISSLSTVFSSIPSRVSLQVESCPNAPPKPRKLPSEIWAEGHYKKAPPMDETSFTQMFKDKAHREAKPLNEQLFTAPVRKPDTQQECKQQ